MAGCDVLRVQVGRLRPGTDVCSALSSRDGVLEMGAGTRVGRAMEQEVGMGWEQGQEEPEAGWPGGRLSGGRGWIEAVLVRVGLGRATAKGISLV